MFSVHMDADTLERLRGQIYADAGSCSFPAFVRRCLRSVGWSVAKIVELRLCDDEACIAAVRTAVAEWADNGADSMLGKFWSLVRAAVLRRLFPLEGTERHARRGGHGWWATIMVCTLPAIVQ